MRIIGGIASNYRISKNDLLVLILLIFVPFIVIVLLTYPLASGVHGTTHSEPGNSYNLPGSHGHFEGDLYIGDNTGWVFCNGKMRYSGELHIKNAELEYRIDEEDYMGSMLPSRYQEIKLDGEKGEMKEGIPFYFLGFLGSAFGFILWIIWYGSKQNLKYAEPITLFSIVMGVISLSFIGFNAICFGIYFITIPLGVILLVKFLDVKDPGPMVVLLSIIFVGLYFYIFFRSSFTLLLFIISIPVVAFLLIRFGGPKKSKCAVLLLIFLSIEVSIYYIVFSIELLIISIIAIIIGVISVIIAADFTYTKYPKIIKLLIPIGFIIFFISLISIIIPDQYFFPGDDYIRTIALSSVYYGIIGVMTSAAMIGYSFGKTTKPLEKETSTPD